MFPYFILLIVPSLYMVGCYIYRQCWEKYHALSIPPSRYGKALPLFFGILFLLLACRYETIGRDLPNYKYMWQVHPKGGMEYVFGTWSECLFKLYNWAMYHLTDSFQIYLSVTALICIIPIAYIYNQDSSHAYLKMILFVNMVTFIVLFSGLRQSMAVAIGMLAYQCVKKRKMFFFCVFAVAAALMHHSGFMVFFMYPLYHIPLKRKMLIVIIPATAMVFILRQPIFSLLIGLMSGNAKYSSEIQYTGAYGSLILFVLFAIFCYIIADERICDEETLGLRNFLVFACLLQCFASLHSLAMRLNYYYIIFIPLAVGKCLSYPQKTVKQFAKLGEIVLCICFTLIFVTSIYRSSVTGVSTLDTIPYIPFWKGN